MVGDWDLFYYEPVTILSAQFVIEIFLYCSCCFDFLMTTHPSQFASSLNKIGVSYKVAYAVNLTMRYIPDIQEEFYAIRMSQEARGLELSKKGRLVDRIKGNLSLVIPLIFSSLERIDTISTAMELRRFGKNKKRTWYTYQPLKQMDYIVLIIIFFLIGITITLFIANQGDFIIRGSEMMKFIK